MRRITLSVLLNLALIACANAGEDISGVWRDLFTRCRVAVETGKDFDAMGLRDLGQSLRIAAPPTMAGSTKAIMPGYDMAEQRWGIPGDRFVVVETEYPPHGGKTRRSCNLELAPKAKPISADEESLLRAAFLAERDKLLDTGRYEHWNPDPIFSTNLGIRLAGNNVNGCRVVSLLFIDTQSNFPSFLQTGSGEQDGACGGAPRRAHP
ncbi:hypothetical protein CHY08_02855 [Rhizobium leguminosarum bv. viciae]|uniref:hypothetical protein n=1 Tax=Rhizobium leguminosarum TaxID=384 RepID=UPI000B8CCB99|nr:hypothetical protein [Rhizobium leguminosarum]ASR06145.1 hypothetical protein CHY08_02855 [Rhizobium leguminosarum bv. viciae]